jgi:hypothetical protein
MLAWHVPYQGWPMGVRCRLCFWTSALRELISTSIEWLIPIASHHPDFVPICPHLYICAQLLRSRITFLWTCRRITIFVQPSGGC